MKSSDFIFVVRGLKAMLKLSMETHEKQTKIYNQSYIETSDKHYGQQLRDYKLLMTLSLSKFDELKENYKNADLLRKLGHMVTDFSSQITQNLFREAKICGSNDTRRAMAVVDYMLDFEYTNNPDNYGLGFRQFLWEQVAEHGLLEQLLPKTEIQLPSSTSSISNNSSLSSSSSSAVSSISKKRKSNETDNDEPLKGEQSKITDLPISSNKSALLANSNKNKVADMKGDKDQSLLDIKRTVTEINAIMHFSQDENSFQSQYQFVTRIPILEKNEEIKKIVDGIRESYSNMSVDLLAHYFNEGSPKEAEEEFSTICKFVGNMQDNLHNLQDKSTSKEVVKGLLEKVNKIMTLLQTISKYYVDSPAPPTQLRS